MVRRRRYLLWSDIPEDRILRWDETSGAVSVIRQPLNNSNGHAVDRQGRLVSCEHLTRRITRTEYDGTAVSDRFQGKRFNSPNDVAVKSDGTVTLSGREECRLTRRSPTPPPVKYAVAEDIDWAIDGAMEMSDKIAIFPAMGGLVE